MQAPKKRKSKSTRGMRRAHDFLVPVQTSKCASCGEAKLPHHVCPSCGMYRGRKLREVPASE